MLDLANKAWQENKLKVLLVVVPVGLLLIAALFFKAYRSYLVASAKKLLEKAVSKDKQLSQESDKANEQAEEHKKKADELAKKAKKIDEENDPDWNKKV